MREGQDTKEEFQKRNLREELEERKHEHYSSRWLRMNLVNGMDLLLHFFDKQETENGLVEVVVLLVSEMPHKRLDLSNGKLGICYQTKHDYIKSLEKWRSKVSGHDCPGQIA